VRGAHGASNDHGILLSPVSPACERSSAVRRLRLPDLPALRHSAGARGRIGYWLIRGSAPAFLSLSFGLLLACNAPPAQQPAAGSAYAVPPILNLHKDLGTKSSVVGSVKHGDRLDVLDTRRRFIKVRTTSGVEGWTELTLLLSEQQMNDLRSLAATASKLPSQGAATVYETLNVHAEPYRQSPSFFQIPEGGTVEVIGHRVTPHTPAPSVSVKSAPTRRAIAPKKAAGKKTSAPVMPLPVPPQPPKDWLELSRPRASDLPAYPRPQAAGVPPAADDWTLVRARDGETGWALARMLVMKVPDEVAQYAEGHRITAYMPLGEVKDRDKQEAKNNWLWTTASTGLLPFEFDSFRVFVWSAKRHHYETAYIERNVRGYYPLETVSLPGQDEKAFSLVIEDKDGHLYKRTYGFSGYHVRMISKTPYQSPALPEVHSAAGFSASPAPTAVGTSWSDRVREWRKKWMGR
jgi:hypothetical protein